MKLKSSSITTIGTILFALGFSMPAFSLPLQVGVYSVGSRYIQIAQKRQSALLPRLFGKWSHNGFYHS